MEVARLVASPVVLRLSLALLHFLWQGLALSSLVALGLLALRRARPGARYALLLAALLLMLACPVVTFFALPQPAIVSPVPTIAPAASAPILLSAGIAGPRITRVSPAPSPVAQLRAWVAARLPWLGAFWAMGVIVLSLRLLGGWIGLTSLRGRGTRPLEGDWPARLSQLAARLGVRRTVELLASARVLAPMLVGWLRPAILLPAGAVIGLTPDQLEAVIAHELAHLRRHDYLVNLLQSLAETLLFYHPAVWWLSRRIRLERECCCDDLAVAACGDAMVYARALTALGQLGPPQLAPAATGGPLSVRIRRLLSAPAPRPHRPSWLAGAIALAGVGLLVAFLEAPTPAVAARKEPVKRIIAQVVEAVQVYVAPEPAAASPVTPRPILHSATESVPLWQMPDPSLASGPKEEAPQTCQVGSITAPRGPIITRMHHLQHVSPQYVLYQLGLSDDPGPHPYLRDPDFAKPLSGTAAGGIGTSFVPGGGRAGAGGLRGGQSGTRVGEGARRTRLGPFLPEGISDIVAYPMLNSLLIRGTEEGVTRLVEFLKLIDRKPQQIMVEAEVLRVNRAALEGRGVQWFHNVGSLAHQSEAGGAETKISDFGVAFGKDLAAVLDDLVATSQAEVTDAARMATMNLLPVETGFTNLRVDQESQWRISRLVPRINGDGTITMYFDLQGRQGVGASGVRTTTLRTTVNIRSGETFFLGGFAETDEEYVVAITATIVPER